MDEDIREFVEKKLKDGYIKSVHNKISDKIFYSGPYWDNEEVCAAIDALINGRWLSSGEKVRKFEKEFSNKININHSVMVNSGSSANLVLIGACKNVLKWEDDDEIIVSPVGFPTTIAPIVQHRLRPVFVDIEFETLNFNVDLIEEKISDRTKAIFVSPVLGNPPDMDKIISICEKHEILILLDGCDSLGSKWRGQHLAEYALATSCSFYPAHHLSTGEGGMVSSDDMEIVKVARSLAWWGRDCYCVGAANLLRKGTCGHRFDKWLDGYDEVIDHKYIFANMGFNLKPLDLQGAIGLAQIKKLDEIDRKRKHSKKVITEIVERNWDVSGVEELEHAETSWFGTPIICRNKPQKDFLVDSLEKNGIQTRNYFAGNILLHPGYSHLDDYRKYPLSNLVLDKVFFIGAAPHYDQEIFDRIETIVSDISKTL